MNPSRILQLAALTALAATAALLPSSPAIAAGKASTCATDGKTVKKGSVARIYQVKAVVKGTDGGSINEVRTYGCYLPTGDRVRFDERCSRDDVGYDDAYCLDRPTRVVINGPWVGAVFSTQDSARESPYYWDVLAAKLGKTPLVRWVADSYDFGEATRIDRLFVGKRGGFAYSAVADTEDDGVVKQIHRIAPLKRGVSTRDEILDSGAGVVTTSLTVSDSQMRWEKGGQRKVASW